MYIMAVLKNIHKVLFNKNVKFVTKSSGLAAFDSHPQASGSSLAELCLVSGTDLFLQHGPHVLDGVQVKKKLNSSLI